MFPDQNFKYKQFLISDQPLPDNFSSTFIANFVSL